MKRILAVILLLVAVMIPVSGAGAATPQAKQIKTLQKQVKALQSQVKTLNSKVNLTYSIAVVNWRATACTLAMVADSFQATWATLDNAGISGAPFAALLTPLDDYGACTDVGLTRQTGLGLPSWTPFTSFLSFLYGP